MPTTSTVVTVQDFLGTHFRLPHPPSPRWKYAVSVWPFFLGPTKTPHAMRGTHKTRSNSGKMFYVFTNCRLIDFIISLPVEAGRDRRPWRHFPSFTLARGPGSGKLFFCRSPPGGGMVWWMVFVLKLFLAKRFAVRVCFGGAEKRAAEGMRLFAIFCKILIYELTGWITVRNCVVNCGPWA